MKPDNEPIQPNRMLLILDFPTELHKGHSAVKKNQNHKGQDSDPVDIMLSLRWPSRIRRVVKGHCLSTSSLLQDAARLG